MKQLGWAVVLATFAVGCNCGDTATVSHEHGGDSGSTGGAGGSGGGSGSDAGADGGLGANCTSRSTDLSGCPCTASGSRACYPNDVPAATIGVGPCANGSQTCVAAELTSYGPCTGAVTPVREVCNDQVDNDCNGLTDCQDPSCATDPACNVSCTPSQTRACYTGPAGTQGVGTCHNGVQTCGANGQWASACANQQLPTSENCCDALDHNCNGLPGCFDIFSCLTASCCQAQCNLDAGPGCSCPHGAGDTATCPGGTYGVSGGGLFGGWTACCPCTGSSCSNAACCGATVCLGNNACSGLTCHALPASCNGQVNADCDDFPEDCDEPCCPCSTCNCGQAGATCATGSDCCSQTCNGSTCN